MTEAERRVIEEADRYVQAVVGTVLLKDALLRRIVAAFDLDRAGHDMRCLPELVAAIADAREVVR